MLSMVNMEEETYHTLEEIAKVFRVSRNTLKKDIDSGELSALQIGKQYRISESSLQEYINKRRLDKRQKGQ
jgi:excisionase family DNA binding protein